MVASKLSIITINYNNKNGLQKTIASVINQTFHDFEYIVIDGGSTDGSKALIEKNSSQIAYWVSEKDNGIYHAMNKGIEAAKGEYLLMLNSGDYLYDDEILEKVFSKPVTEKLIYGNLVWDDAGKMRNQYFPKTLSYGYFRGNSLGHQSAFIHRSLHHLVGLYDTSFIISADWAFFVLAVCKHNCTYKHLPLEISVCSRDGLSCKPESWPIILEERRHFLKNEFSCFEPEYNDYKALQGSIANIRSNFYFKVLQKLRLINKNG